MLSRTMLIVICFMIACCVDGQKRHQELNLILVDLHGAPVRGLTYADPDAVANNPSNDKGALNLRLRLPLKQGVVQRLEFKESDAWVFPSIAQYVRVQGKPARLTIMRRGDSAMLQSPQALADIAGVLLRLGGDAREAYLSTIAEYHDMHPYALHQAFLVMVHSDAKPHHRALAAAMTGDYQSALDLLAQVPATDETQFQQVRLLLATGDSEQALRIAKTVHEAFPLDFAYIDAYIDALVATGRLEEALAATHDERRFRTDGGVDDPRHWLMHIKRADLLMATEQWDQAMALLENVKADLEKRTGARRHQKIGVLEAFVVNHRLTNSRVRYIERFSEPC